MQTSKNRLQELTKRSKQPKPPPSDKGHPIIGQPHRPCHCGGTVFSVTRLGEEVCWGCEYERAHGPGVEFAIGLVPERQGP